MGRKHYDVFVAEPGVLDRVSCKVCGCLCTVTRDAYGPTGFVEAMGRKSRRHDRFDCPNKDTAWHRHALELVLAIDGMPSRRVTELMKLDLDELLQEHASG